MSTSPVRQNNPLLARVAADIESLSPSEARVADWVLQQPRRAVESSLAELAQAAGVSEPTVVRFCRSVGAPGFRIWKQRLLAALSRPESFLHNSIESTDTVDGAAQKVIESAIQALVQLREAVPKQPIEPAVKVLMDARQLIFVGFGASAAVARDAWHKFFRLGLPATTALDSQTMLQHAAIAAPGDVYLAISHSGQWPDTLEAMQLAQQRSATVIGFTRRGSPLAELADLVFDELPPEDGQVQTPMASRLTQLAMLDALQVALALRMGSTATTNLQQSKSVLTR